MLRRCLSRRTLILMLAASFLVLLAARVPTSDPRTSRAQDDTPAALINAALADLNTRLNAQLSLNDLASWRWDLNEYPDTSLGCPQEGQTYAQVATNGYRITFVYGGGTFDYRANENGSILFLCSAPAVLPSVQPTPAPTTAATQVPAAESAPATTATPVGRAVCENAMNTRLSVGQQGRVRPAGLPVNLRQQASASSQRVDQIAPGDSFDIIGGPTCAENLVWWNVQYGTVTGWAAEGANGIYWLEPTGSAATTGSSTVGTSPPTAAPAADTTTGVAPGPSADVSEEVIVHSLPEGFRRVIGPDNAAQVDRQLEYPIAEAVTGVAWSPDRVILAVTTQSGVRLYNMLAYSNSPRVLTVPDGPTTSAAFNTDGTLIATGHNDTIVRVWDTSTGGLRGNLRGHTQPVWSVAYHPDGITLASGGGDPGSGEDSAIRLWNASTRAEIALLEGHTGAVTALAFSPDGTLLASASLDGTVRLWDVDIEDGTASASTTLTTHDGPVRDVAFSPDNAWLASAGDDGQIVLWDIEAGQPRSINAESPLQAVAFSLDGTLLVTGDGTQTAESVVRLWDVDSGTVVTALPFYDVRADAALTGLAVDDLGVSVAEALTLEDSGIVRVWGVVE